MVRIKPTRGLALAVVAFVAGTIGPELASGTPGPAASAYHAVNPTRVVDTRVGLGGSTLGEGAVLTVALAGAAGGVSADANAVALNVTVANGSTTSFLTVWPAGLNRPDASSLNWSDGAPRANSVTSKLGTDGAISLFNERGSVDVIIDVVGYYDTAYVEAGSSGPSLLDANGNRIGRLIGTGSSSYTALTDAGDVYEVDMPTGEVTVIGSLVGFLTSDCTGPSKVLLYGAPLSAHTLIQTAPHYGPGEPVYLPGASTPGYDALSFLNTDGVTCLQDFNSPTIGYDLIPHGTLPADFAVPLSIQP